MRVTGTATLAAPAGAVRAALRDRDLLVRAIPGCERLDVTGTGRGRLTVTTAIAAVSGTYTGEVAIIERPEPGLAGDLAGDLAGGVAGGVAGVLDGGVAGGPLVATLAAAGNRGSASAEITVRLAAAGEGATQVSYEVDLAVTGPMAAIGQRMLASIASRLAAEFLAALGSLLSEPAEAPETDAPAVDAAAAHRGVADRGVADRGVADRGVADRGVADRGVVEPKLVESMVAGPTVVRRPDQAVADLGQPRAGTRPAVRSGLLAGGAAGAAGLAGILIGAVLGRRGRAAGRGSR